MSRVRRLAWLSVVFCLVLATASVVAAQGREYIQANYTKYEFEIPMRDGVKLFTAVYVPKDLGRTYPIMLDRTPYSVGPYGIDAYPERIGPYEALAREGFIFAAQDVRGRYLSEGMFVDTRPHQANKTSARDIDESSDTFDTIDWLVKHVPNNNGRVGMWGVSYDGFYAAAGMIDAHPALKAVSPQAPIADCYMGDDCYHNGVFWLPHNFGFYTFFSERAGGPARPSMDFPRFDYGTPDGYEFYLRLGNVAATKSLLHPANRYWNDLVDHPVYNDYWKSRAITRSFQKLPPSIMAVGGYFDAEDLSGPTRVFRAAEKLSPADNHLVLGPWRHGGWARGDGDRLGNLYFASKTSEYYREHIEFPFFMERLKDKKSQPLAKATVFQTGSNRWREFAEWPPRQAAPVTFYFEDRGRLSAGQQPAAGAFDEYVSDPAHPVPFMGVVTQNVPSDWMTEDQRFATKRSDVLVYATEPLTEDLNVAGPIDVKLFVSTTGTDSDFVVKVIDVYPSDYPAPPSPAGAGAPGQPRQAESGVKMGGYQQLVRGEPFRGKYRNGFEKGEPFEPGKQATISYTMPDVCHTFRKGHRVMVQVQSSWFPLGDRNPQTFTDIPNARPSDFQKATERIYRVGSAASGVTMMVER
jgi:putative CocE/NonD family hydrolase